MRSALVIVCLLSLIALVLGPALYFVDVMSLAQTKQSLLAATVIWLVLTPLWMGRDPASGRRVEE